MIKKKGGLVCPIFFFQTSGSTAYNGTSDNKGVNPLDYTSIVFQRTQCRDRMCVVVWFLKTYSETQPYKETSKSFSDPKIYPPCEYAWSEGSLVLCHLREARSPWRQNLKRGRDLFYFFEPLLCHLQPLEGQHRSFSANFFSLLLYFFLPNGAFGLARSWMGSEALVNCFGWIWKRFEHVDDFG